jgi:hypothetical protein
LGHSRVDTMLEEFSKQLEEQIDTLREIMQRVDF